ncbi:MAG: DUF3084 domain-containing protein [Pseudanabaenaceae cyanobacterium bins.68]|nr:DUF3084 domain-containing protein [Pseudanabaenaceae cyanobacterium bins.68]
MDGYILILAVLFLGGTIATVGDRLGSKIGKKRLSIFNLRPRKTATLVTIATGAMISAATLGVILATSSQLRQGLFQLEQIRTELAEAQARKQLTEQELSQSRQQISQARQQLDVTNRQRVQALLQQSQTQAQLRQAAIGLDQIQTELDQVQQKEQELAQRNQTLQAEQQNLLNTKNSLIADQQRLLQSLDQSKQTQTELRQKVATAQIKFNQLENQRTELLADLSDLQNLRDRLALSLQNLRLGDVAIRKEQILAVGVTKPKLNGRELQQVINQLLQQADQTARRLLDFLPDQQPQEPVIKVTEAQIAALQAQIKGDASYAIRIQAAGNFLKRETSVFINAEVNPNRQVFNQGQVIVALNFAPNLTKAEVEAQLQRLFQLANLRATREGVLADPLTRTVGTFSPTALDQLLDMISQIKTKYEIKAIARSPVYTTSPLELELVILSNGVELKRFS